MKYGFNFLEIKAMSTVEITIHTYIVESITMEMRFNDRNHLTLFKCPSILSRSELIEVRLFVLPIHYVHTLIAHWNIGTWSRFYCTVTKMLNETLDRYFTYLCPSTISIYQNISKYQYCPLYQISFMDKVIH